MQMHASTGCVLMASGLSTRFGSKPAVDAAADGGQVAQLHAHDVAQRFPDGSVGKGF